MLRKKEREKEERCASGSVVEYRLAKARVAGSNPVSRLEKNWEVLKKQGLPNFFATGEDRTKTEVL